MDPRWTGRWGALATRPPEASNTAQLKSSRSLMFTEQAVLARVAPICSAIDMKRLLNTSSSSGETCSESAEGRAGGALLRSSSSPPASISAAPARLHHGRAGRLADDRRPVDDGRRLQVGPFVHGCLSPAAAGEHARDLARRGRLGGTGGAGGPGGAERLPAPACAPAAAVLPGVGARSSRASSRGSSARAPAPTASTATASSVSPRPGMRKPYRARWSSRKAAAIWSGSAHGTGRETSVPSYLTWPRRSTRTSAAGRPWRSSSVIAAVSSSARAATVAGPQASSSGASTLRSRSARTSARPMP